MNDELKKERGEDEGRVGAKRREYKEEIEVVVKDETKKEVRLPVKEGR